MADPTEVEGVDEADEQDEGNPPRKNWRKELEERAKAAETRAEAAERKVALSDAGLSGLNEKQVKALLSAHDGDISGEALKATASELGFGGGTSEVASGEPAVQEHADELADLANFSGSPVQPVVPSSEAREQVRQQAANFKGSQSEDEAFLYRNADVLSP